MGDVHHEGRELGKKSGLTCGRCPGLDRFHRRGWPYLLLVSYTVGIELFSPVRLTYLKHDKTVKKIARSMGLII